MVYTHAFYHTLRIFRSTQLLPHYGNNSLGKTGQNQHSVSVEKYFVKEGERIHIWIFWFYPHYVGQTEFNGEYLC